MTTLVFLSNTAFWLLVIDLLWVVATRDRDSMDDTRGRRRDEQDGSRSRSSAAWVNRVFFIKKNRRHSKAMPMDQAINAAITPLE